MADEQKEVAYYYPNPVWDNGDWIKKSKTNVSASVISSFLISRALVALNVCTIYEVITVAISRAAAVDIYRLTISNIINLATASLCVQCSQDCGTFVLLYFTPSCERQKK